MLDFHGYPSAILENEFLHLEYLTTAGPRIVGLSYKGSPNLLADVHDVSADTPKGKYYFFGGHRLWTAPELPETTYIPDASGVTVKATAGEVEMSWHGSYVDKQIKVTLKPEDASLTLVHTVINASSHAIRLAPWAITMLCQGGWAIYPQPVGSADPHGLLPNRLLSLWPYTRLNDPRLVLRDDYILLHATPAQPPVKIGFFSQAGWMAYWREDILFRKSFDLHPGEPHPDFGCNAESYCADRFVELETLGPLVNLGSGQQTQLTETWELFDTLDVPFIPDAIRSLIR